MVVAATLKDEEGEDFVVLLYEATDHSLTRWSYRNILIRKPNYEMSFFECPNFFPLGDRWILLVSPYKPVEYYSGRFDLGTCTFTPLVQGRLDAVLLLEWYMWIQRTAASPLCPTEGRLPWRVLPRGNFVR